MEPHNSLGSNKLEGRKRSGLFDPLNSQWGGWQSEGSMTGPDPFQSTQQSVQEEGGYAYAMAASLPPSSVLGET